MKRSAQVALVLMGVTGTTAAGAYMMPPRPECQPAPRPAASATVNPPQAAMPGQAAAAAEPCRRRSWSGWRWSSGSSYSSYSSSSDSGPYRRQQTTSNYRRSSAPVAVSTALTSTARTSTSTSTSSGSSSSSRGGFGSTGHSMSGGHSGS